MGRPPGRFEAQHEAPLALDFQGPAGKGRLETQHEGSGPGFGLDELVGFRTAAFFRRIDQDGDPFGRSHVHFAQGPQGGEGQDETGLHVQDPRPEELFALDIERHLGQAADRPDGVGMGQHQDAALLGPGFLGRVFEDVEIADRLLDVARDLGPDRLEFRGQVGRTGVHRFFIGRGGFQPNQLFKKSDHLALA